MSILITILIGFISVALVFIVLVQRPKGGGLNSALGGQAATQFMGAANTTDILEKITWGLASCLLALCLVAGIMFKGTPGSTNTVPGMDLNSVATPTTAPAPNGGATVPPVPNPNGGQ